MKRLFGFLLLFVSCQLAAAKLTSVSITQKAGKTSLSFNLDHAIVHKVFTLTNPDRVVVDLEKTDLAFNLQRLNLNHDLIKGVRSGHPNPHTLRLVFEVTDAVMLRATSRQTPSRADNAFSLDISASHPRQKHPSPVRETAASKMVKKPLPPQRVSTRPARNVIVVLDPGHGGHDPGAIGPRRIAEKKVTLAIAQKLKQIIDRQPGMT
ncbi:MAG: AMIN domain-containing protein, partial [Prosthecobacter sp.]|nr:AMIN domain-containing protein [Prosthecobacter sp.]